MTDMDRSVDCELKSLRVHVEQSLVDVEEGMLARFVRRSLTLSESPQIWQLS